jgi:hypothetical protein
VLISICDRFSTQIEKRISTSQCIFKGIFTGRQKNVKTQSSQRIIPQYNDNAICMMIFSRFASHNFAQSFKIQLSTEYNHWVTFMSPS